MTESSNHSQHVMRFLLKGYTGECTLDGTTAMMTSYSVTANTNVIKSQAAMPFFVKGMAGHALRDYPTFSLSVSIQPNLAMFKYILKKLFAKRCGFATNLKFTDGASGITHSWPGACMNGVEVEVSNESLCAMNLSFAYFSSSFGVSNGAHNVKANPVTDEALKRREGIIGPVMMPYHAFKVSYPGLALDSLTDFSFSFNQELSPKHGCLGRPNDELNAIDPMAIVWGLPTLTYNLKYAAGYPAVSSNDYTRVNSHKIVVPENGVSMEIYYLNKKYLTFGKCYMDSFSPALGSSGDYNSFSINGTVYGMASYNGDEEEDSGGGGE